MNRYHRNWGDLGICEGTTDFLGDALRATTLEWRYHCGAERREVQPARDAQRAGVRSYFDE